jgi:SAM-dependent methyltransferase
MAGAMVRDLRGELHPQVSGDRALQDETLENISGAVNYREWLVSLVLPYLGEDPIEVGSGLGDYAAAIADHGFRVTASEAEGGRIARLEQRFAGYDRVTVRPLMMPAGETANHSAVFSYNVLEHIEDDRAAVESMTRLIRPGGRVALLVPAFPGAMSPFDRRIGHFRRYSKGSVRALLTGAGLDVDVLRYVNSLGLPAWFLCMRMLKMSARNGPLLILWDRLGVPVVRWIEKKIDPPFGQSIFAVATKPERP